MTLPEKWLTVDPGEDTGYALWSGEEFLDSGTEKMWTFGDAVWEAAIFQHTDMTMRVPLDELAKQFLGVTMVVVENWSLYPWVLKTGAMDFDECRTARLIGSLFQLCRLVGWTYEQQPAKIKERAVAAGAENFYAHPLRENRHANDAIQHGVFRIALEQKAKWADLSETSWVVEA